jgi:hypothetical protein
MNQSVPGKGNETFEQLVDRLLKRVEKKIADSADEDEVEYVILEGIRRLLKEQEELRREVQQLRKEHREFKEEISEFENEVIKEQEELRREVQQLRKEHKEFKEEISEFEDEVINEVKRLQTEIMFIRENEELLHLKGGGFSVFPKPHRISKLNAAIFPQEEEKAPFYKF